MDRNLVKSFAQLNVFRLLPALWIVALVVVAPSLDANSAVTLGNKSLRIAVLDTGLDLEHNHLRKFVWQNPGESGVDALGRSKANNGIDDDGNGYVDDIHGWNFSAQNADLTDETGHGTHVTGLIKDHIRPPDQTDSFEFVVLKYYRPGMGRVAQREAFLKALKYAVDLGVEVINISGGGRHFSWKERNLLNKAQEAGTVVVAAAGNKSRGDGDFRFFPAAYHLPNIFSVAALDTKGNLLATSNVNPGKPNILARGERLRSTVPGNRFDFKTGSSQATAIVTGYVASQMMARKNVFLFKPSTMVAEALVFNN